MLGNVVVLVTSSVLVANPKKILYTAANPACGLLNRGKKKEKKSAIPSRAARSEKKKQKRDAYTCLDATQVSVRLASVRGLLGLVG